MGTQTAEVVRTDKGASVDADTKSKLSELIQQGMKRGEFCSTIYLAPNEYGDTNLPYTGCAMGLAYLGTGGNYKKLRKEMDENVECYSQAIRRIVQGYISPDLTAHATDLGLPEHFGNEDASLFRWIEITAYTARSAQEIVDVLQEHGL